MGVGAKVLRDWRTGVALSLVGATLVVGCSTVRQAQSSKVRVANQLGKEAITRYGCGSCHLIPGVPGADGLVGPPLQHFNQRGYIAGQLANTPDNLVRWLRNPQEVEPGTAMPNLGVTDEDARNIAAYLMGLQ